MRRTDSRAGFSLLEAIMVLAITSLTLMLIFSIGSRSSQTGFRLGNRAMSVADAQMGADTVRAVLRGLAVPASATGGRPMPDFQGSPQAITAGASPSRATPCGGPGPAGIVRLGAMEQNHEWYLTCQSMAPGGPALLVNLHGARPTFSYSTDGRIWGDMAHVSATPSVGTGADRAVPREQRLLVRIASDDGRFQVLEMLSSGPPKAPGGAGS